MPARFLCACAVLLCLHSPASGEAVFDAEPNTRVRSNQDETSREVLSAVERAKSKVAIVWHDGHYLWASREGRELVFSGSLGGPGYFFAEPNGAGYVKVFDTHQGLPDGVRPQGPRFRFIEHVHILLDTITYWGETESFNVAALNERERLERYRAREKRLRQLTEPSR